MIASTLDQQNQCNIATPTLWVDDLLSARHFCDLFLVMQYQPGESFLMGAPSACCRKRFIRGYSYAEITTVKISIHSASTFSIPSQPQQRHKELTLPLLCSISGLLGCASSLRGEG